MESGNHQRLFPLRCSLLKPVKFPMDSGSLERPISLESRSNRFKLVKFPMESGRHNKPFLLKSNLLKSVKFPMESGSTERLLNAIFNRFKLVKFPMESGNHDKLFSLKSNLFKSVNSPIESGNISRLLCHKDNTLRLVKSPIESGSVESSLLPKYRYSKLHKSPMKSGKYSKSLLDKFKYSKLVKFAIESGRYESSRPYKLRNLNARILSASLGKTFSGMRFSSTHAISSSNHESCEANERSLPKTLSVSSTNDFDRCSVRAVVDSTFCSVLLFDGWSDIILQTAMQNRHDSSGDTGREHQFFALSITLLSPIHDIIPRSFFPTSSIWCCCALPRSSGKRLPPVAFSSIHSLANSPD